MRVTRQKSCNRATFSRTSGEEKRRLLSVDGSRQLLWSISASCSALTALVFVHIYIVLLYYRSSR